jgi:hypothetical protein
VHRLQYEEEDTIWIQYKSAFSGTGVMNRKDLHFVEPQALHTALVPERNHRVSALVGSAAWWRRHLTEASGDEVTTAAGRTVVRCREVEVNRGRSGDGCWRRGDV